MHRIDDILNQLNMAWDEFVSEHKNLFNDGERDTSQEEYCFIEERGTRSKSVICDEIADLKRDIMKAEISLKRGSITNEQFHILKDRYTGYIECFQYALGEVDCYGRTDSFEY